MTETKKGSSPYTAGPWIQTWQIDPDSEPVIAVTTQKNEVIAMVYPDGHPDEVEANASLIAAAPELLAALKGSTVFIEQALTDLKGREETATYRDFWNRLQAARNAIAKTEGKDFPTAGW